MDNQAELKAKNRMVKSSKVRALIIGLLGRQNDVMSLLGIGRALESEFKDIGYNPHGLYHLLPSMARGGLITAVESAPGEHSLYSNRQVAQHAPAVKTKVKITTPRAAPDIKVSVLKSSGNILFTLRGITIEVGVE